MCRPTARQSIVCSLIFLAVLYWLGRSPTWTKAPVLNRSSVAATGQPVAVTLAGLLGLQEEHGLKSPPLKHLFQFSKRVSDTAVNMCTGQGMDTTCFVSGVVGDNGGRISILVETGKSEGA